MPRRALRDLAPAVAVLALGLAWACVERPPPAPPSPRPPTSGTIRLGYPEEPPTLNPVTESSPAAADVLRAVLPSFFLVTPELDYRPYLLAEEPVVATEADRMLVDFRIRGDARWSDGRPITVDDVAFTWRVMTDASVDAAVPHGFDNVVAIRARSSKSGTIVLRPPLASWRELFSAGRWVLPAHAAERVADVETWDDGPPVSGGPFEIRRWVRGLEVELVANRRFFGPRPLARRIVVRIVPDATTALQLLEAGRLDALAPMLGTRWGERLRAIDDVELSARFGADVVALVVNARSVAGAAARRLLIDAVDRERFVDVVLGGDGRVAHGVLAPEQPGAVAGWEPYGDDAPRLVTSEEELTLVHLGSEVLGVAGRYVQSEIQDAGGNIELVPVEGDVLWEEFLEPRAFDLALVEVRSGPSPPLSRWADAPGAAPALTQLDDARLASLLTSVERSGTETPSFARAQRRLARLAVVLPLFQPKTTAAWRAGVAGVRVNPSVDGILWNAWDWSKGS